MNYKRFLIPIYLLLVVIAVGTTGYMLLEHWNFLDALYMTVITVATIGYEETHNLDNAGKVFNIFLIVSSIATTAFALTRLTRYVIDGEINLYFKTRRLMSNIDKLDKHVILCGFGRNGKQAAKTLMQHKVDFVIIEKNNERIEEAVNSGKNFLFLQGDATEDDILQKAGINKASALITALPEDADNVFIVLTARSANEHIRIISRASNAGSVPKLKKAGANNVILPDKIGGTHMATLVTRPDVIEFIDYLSGAEGEAIHLEAVGYESLPEDLKDRSLKEVMEWRKTGVNCLGVKDQDGRFIINPPETIAITKGMKVIVLGTKDQIEEMKGNVTNKLQKREQ